MFLLVFLSFLLFVESSSNFINYPQVNSTFTIKSDKLLYHVAEVVRFEVNFPTIPEPDLLLGEVFFQVHARSRPEFNRNITEMTGLLKPVHDFKGTFVIPSMFSGITYFMVCSVCYKMECQNLYGRAFEFVGPVGVFNSTTGKPPPNELTNPNSGIPTISSCGYDNSLSLYKVSFFVVFSVWALLIT